MRTLDFWFDYSCPYAYLASTRVEAIAQRTGATLAWKPMLLGGVFEASGTPQRLFETLSPAKARHNALDMQRWAEAFSVPLTMPASHPMRTVDALRATISCGCDPRVVHAFYRAYWVEGRSPSDRDVMREVLARAGHDADAVIARAQSQEIKDELRARTSEAVAKGVFGAPTMIVDGERLYWGQDRLEMVERDLRRQHTLEFYWDFASPFAYLGSTQAEAVARRTGAKLVWRPMLLGGVFKAIGQNDVPLFSWSDSKRRFYFEDMHRWAALWGVPLRFPSRFPTNSLKAMRCYLALPEESRAAFREKTFHAFWAEDRDIADEATLRELIGEGADEVIAHTQSPEVKKELIDATERAVKAGVFGAPTWVVDGEHLFWGQDRIPLVERTLTVK